MSNPSNSMPWLIARRTIQTLAAKKTGEVQRTFKKTIVDF